MSDETTYDKLPLFLPGNLSRVPEQLYGDAVRSVTRAIGPCTDEEAMRVIDAVLGPLRLVSPKPEHYEPCSHSRFTHGGRWLLCDEDHDETGRTGFHSMTHPDLEEGYAEWDDDDKDGRSFVSLSEVRRDG